MSKYIDYKDVSMDIKAIIFDVVESEKKTISILEKQISSETDNEKKEKLETIKKEKDQKLEGILSKIDSVVEDLKLINNINVKNDLIFDESSSEQDEFTVNISDTKEEADDDIDLNLKIEAEEENSEEPDEEKVVETEEENSEEADEEKVIETEEEKPEEENSEEADEEKVIETEEENSEEESAPSDESENKEQDILYAFNKDDKILPKAIMVKQTDQYPKLKSSCDKAIEKFNEMSVFEGYDYKVSTAHSLQGNVIDQDIEKELDLNENKYDDVERYIEDLTVKASIYTNEGEMEKANTVNKKIAELKNRGKKTEEE